jgi:small-conductance mechanosensitive channel
VVRTADPVVGRSLPVRLSRPAWLFGPVLGARIALPLLVELPPALRDVLDLSVSILVVVAGTWTLIAATSIAKDWLNERYDLDAPDNLRARRIHTKFDMLRRILVIVASLLALGAILFTIPGMRSLGAGLLASAGIAGIAVGIAARPTLETLLAGLQLALTEPINLDDVVIVEGEWGRIEEIRATYVVVRIWDQRRLVVPVSWFLTQPFQNWTRVTADLLAAVTVDVDYRTPVDEVRTAAEKIVSDCPQWDRKYWGMQVVDADPRSMRLRVLASVGNSGDAWDLRCAVREKLIAWLQTHHPQALPRLRVETGAAPPAPDDDESVPARPTAEPRR